uniref:C-type lectin domain-containing protein n=1 Tax=Kryptolebias marmoratus TaxID=37003 RepID=A0A3Q3BEE2_KRYMA
MPPFKYANTVTSSAVVFCLPFFVRFCFGGVFLFVFSVLFLVSFGLLSLLFPCVILSTCFPYQYHFADQSLTWTEAQTYCRQKHTDLVSIRNSEELNQLINMLSSAGHSSEVWIGLFKEFDWKWSDGFNGTGAEYRNWETNQPDMCGVTSLQNSGQWKFSSCETKLPFVCYKPAGECFTALH